MPEHVERGRKNDENNALTIFYIFVDYPSGAGHD
jgi:hypothetical protein